MMGVLEAEKSPVRSRCWHKRDLSLGCTAYPGTLICTEEEDLVLDNRPAETPAKLVAFKSILARSEKVPGVQSTISEKFERTSMKLVRAGASHADITTPPPAFPYCAEKLLDWRLNSAMASGLGNGRL